VECLPLSERTGLLQPSPTLKITSLAKAMQAEGIDVISFAAGEPDFPTPAPIVQAAIDALNAGFTKYTPTTGTKELKQAISDKLLQENQVKVAPEQVVVGCGAKHSLYQTMMVLLNPGDEAILIAPYWMTYADQIRIAGAKPVVVAAPAQSGFVPDIAAIREKVTAKTKAIVINSPSNPTGAAYPPSLMQEIASLAVEHRLWVITDEIYERLIYDGVRHQSIAALGDEIAAQTVTIGGCSKTYSMTGWRIGFAAAPVAVAKAMGNLQDQLTSNPTSFAQSGAIAAFHMPAEAVEKMRAEFQARRDLIVQGLRSIPDVGILPPKGAFYALADFSAYIGGRFRDDTALADYLLSEFKVAAIPGSVFEAPGHLRLSYATSRMAIEKGLARIAEALATVRA
jgi:aspartate aminotransferase